MFGNRFNPYSDLSLYSYFDLGIGYSSLSSCSNSGIEIFYSGFSLYSYYGLGIDYSRLKFQIDF